MVTYAIPVLPARDLGETLDFWRDELGFAEVFRGDDYGIVERDRQQVHFFSAPRIDPWTNDGGCRLGVDDPRSVGGVLRDDDVVRTAGRGRARNGE